MKYRVDFGAEAQKNFYEAARWWATNRSTEQAARWVEQSQVAIEGLANNPARHSIARENERFSVTLRELLFGIGRRPTHRALFYIEGDTVFVVSIRRLAQRELTPDDLNLREWPSNSPAGNVLGYGTRRVLSLIITTG